MNDLSLSKSINLYGTGSSVDLKRANVTEATRAKQLLLGGDDLLKTIAIGMDNENDLAQDQLLRDLDSMPRDQLRSKYGDEVADNRWRYLENRQEIENILNRRRSAGETVKDTALDVASTLTNIAGGTAALGATVGPDAILGRIPGAPALSPTLSKWTQDAAQFFQDQKSDAFQQKAGVHAVRGMLDQEDRAAHRAAEEARLTEEGANWFARVADPYLNEQGQAFLDTIDNYADQPTVASKLIPEGVASIGGIRIGMGISARMLARRQLAKQGVKGSQATQFLKTDQGRAFLSSMRDKTALPTIAATETGSAVTQAQNEILSMPLEELADDPSYQELAAKGMSEEDIRNNLARDAGFVAAAIGLPVTAVLGKISEGFAKAPLKVEGDAIGSRMLSAARNIGSEALEETAQNVTGTLAGELGQKIGGGLDVEVGQNIGADAAEGLLSGALSAGAVQAPGLAVSSAAAAAKPAVGAAGKAVSSVATARKAKRLETAPTGTRAQSEADARVRENLSVMEEVANQTEDAEVAAPLKESADRVKSSLVVEEPEADFYASEYETLGKERTESGNPQVTRGQIISHIGQKMVSEKDSVKRADDAVRILAQVLEVDKTDADDVHNAVEALPEDHEFRKAYEVTQGELDTVRSHPMVAEAKKIIESMDTAAFEQIAGGFTALRSKDFTSQQAEGERDMLLIVANHNKAAIPSDLAKLALNQASSTKAPPKVVKSLDALAELTAGIEKHNINRDKVAEDLTAAIEALQSSDPEKAKKEAANVSKRKTPEMVRREILDKGNSDNSMPSLVQLDRDISLAANAGKTEQLKGSLRNLYGMAKTLANKMDALNLSASEGGGKSYRAWSPKKPAFYDAPGKLTYHKDSPGSHAFAMYVEGDAQLAVNHYNKLLELHAEAIGLDAETLEKSKIPLPKFTGKAPKPESSSTPPAQTKVVLPVLKGREKHHPKDQKKADLATKFIGRGSPNSSTAAYAKAFGSLANSGQYTDKDVVFISAEGNRNGRLDPDFAEIGRAIEVGAEFVTDIPADRGKDGDYNVGERQVAAFLEKNGYAEYAPGRWAKKKAGEDESSSSEEPKPHARFDAMARAREGAWRLRDAFIIIPDKSALVEHDHPAQFLLENLENIHNTAATPLAGPLTGKAASNIREILEKQVPAVVEKLQANLKHKLDPNRKNADGTRAKDMDRFRKNDKYSLSYQDTLAMNFVVQKEDGSFEFDSAVAEAAAMAGFAWLIRSNSSGSRKIKPRHIAKAFGVSESVVAENPMMRQAYLDGPRYHEAISEIARDLEEMLGLQQKDDVSSTVAQGISRGMAANVLEAMRSDDSKGAKKFIREKTWPLKIRRRGLDGKDKVSPENYKVLRPWRLGDSSNRDAIRRYQDFYGEVSHLADLFKMAFVKDVEPEILVGKPRKRSKFHAIRNPFRLTGRLEDKVVDELDNTAFRANMTMFNLRQGLGQDHMNRLLHNRFLVSVEHDDIENSKLFNKIDAIGVKGKLDALNNAWRGVDATIQAVKEHADTEGLAHFSESPLYFTHEISSVGRIQQYGRVTPQGSKEMREMFSATESELTLSDEKHLAAFWLAVAQNSGISVEKGYLEEAQTAAQALVDDGGILNGAVVILENFYLELEENPEAIMSLETREAFNEIIEDAGSKGVSISEKLLHALGAVAEFNIANARKQETFKTRLSFEADGKTDGPFNAMFHLSVGKFTPDWVRRIAKGGLVFANRPISLNEWIKDFDKEDLYHEGAAKVDAATIRHYNALPSNVREGADHLMALMGTLLPDLSYSDENVEKGRTPEGASKWIKIGRNVIKNPLTIFIYGSGRKGVSDKVTSQMLDTFYAALTDILHKKADGTIAQTKEHELFNDPGFARSFEWLLNNKIEQKKDGSWKIFTLKGDRYLDVRRDLFRDMVNAEIPSENFQVLSNNVEMIFGIPLWQGVDAATGGLQSSMEFLQKASQLQTLAFQNIFQQQVADLEEERRKAGVIGKDQLLSRRDYLEAMKRAFNIAPIYETDEQEFHISSRESTSGEQYIARSLSGSLRTGASIPAASDASVKVSPYLTIGTGDGRMILNIYADGKVEVKNSLPVFDGVELALDQMFAASSHINAMTHKALMDSNAYEALAKSFEQMLPHLTDETLAAVNNMRDDISRIFKQRDFDEDPITIEDFREFQENLQEGAFMSAARKYAVEQVSHSLDHMAGAGEPHAHSGEKVSGNPNDYEAIAEQLNTHYYKKLKELRREDAREDARPIQEGNRKNIQDLLGRIGFRNTNFNTTYVPAKRLHTIFTAENGFTQEQIDSAKALVDHFGWGVLESVDFHFGNQADLDRQRREEYGLTGGEPLGRGIYYPGKRVAFLSSRSGETILHEVLHVYTAEILHHYYHNKDKQPPHIRQALGNLESLMADFRKMNFRAHTAVENKRGELVEKFTNDATNQAKAGRTLQRVLNGLDGQTGNPETDSFLQMSEFISWMLSNQQLMKIGQKQKVYTPFVRWAHRVMREIKNLLGMKKVRNPKSDMLSQIRFNTQIVLSSFDQATVDSLANIGLNQVSATSQVRLEGITRQYLDRAKTYLDAGWDAQQSKARRKDVRKALFNARDAVSHARAKGFDMAPAEIHSFKAIHAALQVSMRLNPAALRTAGQIYAAAVRHLKPEDFKLDPTDYTYMRRYEHILGSGQGSLRHVANGRSDLLATFLTLAQVNDKFRDILSTVPLPKTIPPVERSFDGYLTGAASTMMNYITRLALNKTKQAPDTVAQLDILTEALAEIQTDGRIAAQLDRMRVIDPLNDAVSGLVQSGAEKLSDKVNKMVTSRLGRNRANGGRLWWLGTTALGTVGAAADLVSKKNSAKRVDGMKSVLNRMEKGWTETRALLSDITGMDADSAILMRMVNPVKALVDAVRQDAREAIPDELAKKFSRRLSRTEWKHLFFGIGRADMLSLGLRASVNILTNPSSLSHDIAGLEEALDNMAPQQAALYKEKAMALATWMVKREVTSTNLLKNARSIARLHGENMRPATFNAPLVRTIDHLTSLYAYRLLDPEVRDNLRKLMAEERDAMTFLLGFHEDRRKLEDQKVDELRKVDPDLADDIEARGWKGYVPELTREGISLIVEDDSKADELRIRGYVRVGDYIGDRREGYRGKRGYYFSGVAGDVRFNQGIAQTVHSTWRGVDTRTGQSRTGHVTGWIGGVAAEAVQRRSGNPRNGLPAGEYLIPVYDRDGDIRGYERPLAASQIESLDQDQHLGRMLGVWTGRIIEEREGDRFNRELVEKAKIMFDEHVKKGRASGTRNEFVNLADPHLEDAVLKDAWSTLGWKIKKDVAEVFGSKDFFPVRRDMAEQVIGYRAFSVVDPVTGITRMSPEFQKASREMMTGIFGADIFRYLKHAENIVQDAVGYAKTSIVIRSFIVAWENLISNQLQMMAHGVNPVSSMVQSAKKFAEITQYTANRDAITRLDIELASTSTGPRQAQKIRAQMQALEDANRALSIWPLIAAGEFSTISESLTEADMAIREGKLSEYLEKAAEKLPNFARTAGKNILITKDTAIYRTLNRLVQYGDFVSKAVLYDHYTRKRGQSHEQVMDLIAEEFVNYNRLGGRGRDYLESMGLLWFYNYKLRSVKVALRLLRDRPVSALLMGGGLAPVLDVDTVASSQLLGVLADGSWDYSVGPSMGVSAITGGMHPWLALTN